MCESECVCVVFPVCMCFVDVYTPGVTDYKKAMNCMVHSSICCTISITIQLLLLYSAPVRPRHECPRTRGPMPHVPPLCCAGPTDLAEVALALHGCVSYETGHA